MVQDKAHRKKVGIKIGGKRVRVSEHITVKNALETFGYKFSKFPEKGAILAPCEVGGCYACGLIINGELRPACTTPVTQGMDVKLKLPKNCTPLRRVSGYVPHSAGGVGTPWWVKKSGQGYIEVACFTHGCNLRCPQCQNFTVTYNNVESPSTPEEAAQKLAMYRRQYDVDRMAVSGGEPTLNPAWLIRFFRKLVELNPDQQAHFHLDTNATILSPSYMDDLVEVGVTDIGPDLKGLHVETFMRVTGLADKELAGQYLQNAWSAVKYLVDKYYPEKLFVGVGVPYNKSLITLEEIREIGDKLAEMNSEVQVCLLDYFPTFRRLISRPTVGEMKKASATLRESGLKTVIAQTIMGYIGPQE